MNDWWANYCRRMTIKAVHDTAGQWREMECWKLIPFAVKEVAQLAFKCRAQSTGLEAVVTKICTFGTFVFIYRIPLLTFVFLFSSPNADMLSLFCCLYWNLLYVLPFPATVTKECFLLGINENEICQIRGLPAVSLPLKEYSDGSRMLMTKSGFCWMFFLFFAHKSTLLFLTLFSFKWFHTQFLKLLN